MTKPYDFSKFRKSITKSIEGLSEGFRDPKHWISSGNYALNYLISGDFYKGVPLGKVTVFAGESGCLPADATVTVHTDTERVVTVRELKELFFSDNPLKIHTPDGYVSISAWYDKGAMDTVKITTASGLATICAINHLLQRPDGEWIPADQVSAGEELITLNSNSDVVVNVENSEKMECFDFTVDHPNQRYWGDGFSSHNSGKSYICSGNIIKNAQEQGVFVVLIDTENALDEEWLRRLGVDTDPEKMIKFNMAMIDDVAKVISEFMKEYKTIEEDQRPKVLFVIDSLGMLLTPTDAAQFSSGDLKGDMGRKPKALKALVSNCVNMFGSYDVGLVATNHIYGSQDPYNPDPIISGGSGFIFASSIVVSMKKLKLKEDEDGNKISEVAGIRSGCKIMKTRYAKPFEDIEVRIPYTTGMSPYSGLFDLFEKKGILKKEGNRYCYYDMDGVEHKYFRKEWNRNTDGILDLVMKEFPLKDKEIETKLAEVLEDNSDSE